jgi:hypothetical protein
MPRPLTSPFAGMRAVSAAMAGNPEPLKARLLDKQIAISMEEREYIACYANALKGIPRQGGWWVEWIKDIRKRSKSLEVARTVIRLSIGYQRQHIKKAVMDAAEQHSCRERTVKTYIQEARRFRRGQWWRDNCRLMHEGKGGELL